MKLINKLEKIKQIDQLIRLQNTGSPRILAERINLSERQTRRYIEEMKDMGAEIIFDKNLSSYRYLQKVKFSYGFTLLYADDMRKNMGVFLLAV